MRLLTIAWISNEGGEEIVPEMRRRRKIVRILRVDTG